ncbi:SURF1 family protein [Nocardioides sp. Y6]|uniref:SURF1-like protein n=1 Tax=Nocardioides malaquae TaxID=2773426 RepID=A0ABR9RS61_9ACTN|nr:SURF1 family protein [Nocardioides malaquae]MBE7324400.1 SURF1 family protein [Nocardioides malaquae]
MQRLGFLVSKRWGFFLVAVALLSWLAWELGQWQFDRLEDRRERNAIIERNDRQDPVDAESVLSVGEAVEADEEWSLVRATGTYAADETVFVRYRTHRSASGVQVVVPLQLESGATLLVDRGWWQTANRGEIPDDVPAPPTGQVEVLGRVRADATGDAARVSDRGTRAISSVEIGEALGRDTLGGFVELVEESPEAATPLTLPDEPELDEGPHFFYGLQWWFFGALAIFGFFYLLYDEWRDRRAETQAASRSEADRRSEEEGRSEAAQEAAVDREGDAVHE